jgi:hypothetical protein
MMPDGLFPPQGAVRGCGVGIAPQVQAAL